MCHLRHPIPLQPSVCRSVQYVSLGLRIAIRGRDSPKSSPWHSIPQRIPDADKWPTFRRASLRAAIDGDFADPRRRIAPSPAQHVHRMNLARRGEPAYCAATLRFSLAKSPSDARDVAFREGSYRSTQGLAWPRIRSRMMMPAKVPSVMPSPEKPVATNTLSWSSGLRPIKGSPSIDSMTCPAQRCSIE